MPLAEAVCVDPVLVHLVWPKASGWIRAALERGDMGTFGSVEADVLAGRALLWLVWNDPHSEGCAMLFDVSAVCNCGKIDREIEEADNT